MFNSNLIFSVLQRLVSLALILAFISGCEPPIQERANIPVIMGMRLDGGTSERDVRDNFDWILDHKMTDLLVEIPFQSQVTPPHLPSIDSLILEQISLLARQSHERKINLHLALMTQNQTEIFPDHRMPSPDLWFRQLEYVSHALLLACGPYPPRRLVFGENLHMAESYTAKWSETFENLRAKWKVPFSYCSYTDRSTADPLWKISDEICLSYSASADENAIPFCREQNMHISAMAEELGKPVFIVRANLLGNNPEKLFDYRLRYWAEDVPVNGICINTIYSRIGPLDSTSYYGIRDSKELIDRICKYATKNMAQKP